MLIIESVCVVRFCVVRYNNANYQEHPGIREKRTTDRQMSYNISMAKFDIPREHGIIPRGPTFALESVFPGLTAVKFCEISQAVHPCP